jgi:segregation and condensation protein B
VLILPEESDVKPDSDDDSDIEQADLLDEEEAMALAKRPLDEILGYNREKSNE